MDDQVTALRALLPATWGEPAAEPPAHDPIVTVRFVNATEQQSTWVENLLAALGVAQVAAYTLTVEPREVAVRKGPVQSFPVATIMVWVAP